jgi:hypothetical protein
VHLYTVVCVYGSWDIAVGIATGYGLEDREFKALVPIRSGIFFTHVVQTGSGAHPAFYPMGARGSFPRNKSAGK